MERAQLLSVKEDSIMELKEKIDDETFNLILGEENTGFQGDLVKEYDEMNESVRSSPLLVRNQQNSDTRLE